MSWDADLLTPLAAKGGLAALIETIQQHCLEILLATPEGVTEYTLMSRLSSQGIPPFATELARDNLLPLFQKHFLLFHALYQLRNALPTGQVLDIHCLNIRLTHRAPNTNTLLDRHDALANYYLDMEQLYRTDTNAVDSLVRFGQARLRHQQQISKAYITLELKPGSPLDDIKKAYRQLAMTHHPDRGGNSERFMEISLAFDILVTLTRKQPQT